MLELKEERKIFGVSSSEVLERLEWNEGNFSIFLELFLRAALDSRV